MPVYTVGQLTRYLKETLERDPLLSDLWIQGEVSNFSRSAAGHVYFTLKDPASQLRCVMFRPGRTASLVQDGAAVIAHGRISFYEVRGDLQFYVDLVQPHGMGELHLELERLKAKLEAEGLFDPSRKRPLPSFPKRIGVITSPTGAVFHDICNVLERRYPLAEVVLCPTAVQGDGAASQIVEAFRAINEEGQVDVIILARGGGSLEELWPFNEEAVARAIYASRAPVISGVGHQTDFTIADYVADVRAPTPSAAAELAAPNMVDLTSSILNAQKAMLSAVTQQTDEKAQSLRDALYRLQRHAPDVALHRQKIDDLTRTAWHYLGNKLAFRKEQLARLQAHLASLSPSQTLARGYAVVQREDTGEVVSRRVQVKVGEDIRVQVSDGAFSSRVTD